MQKEEIIQKTKMKKYNKISNKKAVVGIVASSLVLVLLAVVMETSLQKDWQKEQIATVLVAVQAEEHAPVQKLKADVLARAAIVYDIKNQQVLYSKNAEAQLPLASVTKLITALVADSELGSTSPIYITEQALATEGESGLVAGDSWRERDLADFMLTVSSNDAATALASTRTEQPQFIIKMNEFVQQLGLSSIVLFNESGLDMSEQKAGAYGSARDIANLLAYTVLTKPEILEATTFTEFTSVSATGLRYKAVNTNKIAGMIPGLIGGKTGFTDLAGGNLAIVFDASIGRPIVVVVLGSTVDGRFDDVLTLVNAVI